MATLRQEEDFTEDDFQKHPVWRIARHCEDETAPNTEINERTFSPWKKPITKDIIWPNSKILVAGMIRFADGTMYPGYFQLVGTNWDDPLPPRRMKDGNSTKPLRWSAKRGGNQLSILSLIAPCFFVKGRAWDFHFRKMLQVRETHIRVFYLETAKRPNEVFPVQFETHYGISGSVDRGVIPGFYRFPLDQPHEVSVGEDVWSKYAKR